MLTLACSMCNFIHMKRASVRTFKFIYNTSQLDPWPTSNCFLIVMLLVDVMLMHTSSMCITSQLSFYLVQESGHFRFFLAKSWKSIPAAIQSYAHACRLHAKLYSHETGKCVHTFKLISPNLQPVTTFWTNSILLPPEAMLIHADSLCISFNRRISHEISMSTPFWSIMCCYANVPYPNAFLLCYAHTCMFINIVVHTIHFS